MFGKIKKRGRVSKGPYSDVLEDSVHEAEHGDLVIYVISFSFCICIGYLVNFSFRILKETPSGVGI